MHYYLISTYICAVMSHPQARYANIKINEDNITMTTQDANGNNEHHDLTVDLTEQIGQKRLEVRKSVHGDKSKPHKCTIQLSAAEKLARLLDLLHRLKYPSTVFMISEYIYDIKGNPIPTVYISIEAGDRHIPAEPLSVLSLKRIIKIVERLCNYGEKYNQTFLKKPIDKQEKV